MESPETFHRLARFYAGLGWRVLPVRSRTKLPVLRDWPRKATTDPTTIDEWWGNGNGHGIGIATGQESGIVVVDVDNGPGRFGEDSLDAFVDRVGPLPDSPTALTANGRHLYFKWPGFNPAQDLLGPGIDLQADGRYVVAPPSVHPSGRDYCWEHSLRPSVVPVPELPGIFPPGTDPGTGGDVDPRFGELLRAAGFTGPRVDNHGNEHWTRPGKDPRKGTSVTVYPFPDSHCVCYSTSVPALKVRQPYQPSELARALGVAEREKATAETSASGLTVVKSSTVRPKRQRWLWSQRLPLGSAALLVGQEGLGKSTIAIDVGARATKGTLDGELSGAPVSVVYVSAEDTEASTIVPRLTAAGADLDRVLFVRVDGLVGGLVIPDHLDDLAGVMRSHDARLLVLDPFSAHLPGGSFDSHREHHVRKALAPLAQCMETLDATALGVMHWNKAPTLVALDRILGSRAFSASARSILGVGQDPNDPGSRLLILAKSNLGPLDVPALAFAIDQRCISDPDGGLPIVTSGVEWLGDREGVRSSDLFRVAEPDEGGALDRAKALVEGVLSGGPIDAKELDIAQTVEGISTRTMRRARQELGVIAEPVKDSTGKVTGWTVRLP